MKMSRKKKRCVLFPQPCSYWLSSTGIYIIGCVLLESQKSCGDHLFYVYTPINTKGSS